MKRTHVYLIIFILAFPFLLRFSTPGMARETPAMKLETRKKIQYIAEQAYLKRIESPTEAIQYCSQALDMLKHAPDPRLEINILNTQTCCFISLGRLDAAKENSQKAIHIALEQNDTGGLAHAYKNLGVIYLGYSDYDSAWNTFSKSLRLFEELGDKSEQAKVYNNIGIIYSNLSAHAKTLEYYIKALKISEDLNDPQNIAALTNNIGVVYEDLGKFELALQYYHRALKIFRELNKPDFIANALNNIGSTCNKLGDFPRALQYSQDSLEIAQRIGYKRQIALTRTTLGNIYLEMKQYPLAYKHANDALSLYGELGERGYVSLGLRTIGLILRKTSQFPAAITQLHKSLEIAQTIKDQDQIRDCYKELSLAYADMKDFHTALSYHHLFKDTDDVIFNEDSIKKIADLQIKYNAEKKEKEIQLLKKDNKIRQLDVQKQRSQKNFTLIVSGIFIIAFSVLFALYHVRSRLSLRLKNEIGEHHRTFKMLRESEAKFRTLAEKSLIGIFIIQANVFRYVNPHFLGIFGYTAEELLDRKNIYHLAVACDRLMLEEKVRPAYGDQGEGVHYYEFKGVRGDGEIISLEAYESTTLYNDRPARMGAVIDITHRKRTENEFMKRRKLESIGIVAGGVAHDFDKLLCLIRKDVAVLKSKNSRRKKDQESEEAVENLEKSAAQAAELARKLIIFADGGMPCREKTPFPPLLKSAIDYLPTLRERDYAFHIPEDLLPLDVDPGQFKEVLQNLLLNAAEADPKKFPIEVSAENLESFAIGAVTPHEGGHSPAKWVKITIKDNGVGIPGDKLEQIFDPYYSTKDTYSQKGMGLGLSISYTIVKKHGGHITLESEPGRGAAVYIHIPAWCA